MPFLLAVLGWKRRDAVAFVVGSVAVLAILVNGLFLQTGSHPASLVEPTEGGKAVHRTAKAARLPKVDAPSVPVAPKLAAPHSPRTQSEIIRDLQRELARRGYYDGPLDGLYGARTDSAIREFERAASLKPSAQPSEELLQAITQSPLGSVNARRSTPVNPANESSQADRPERVIGVQRALTEFGYSQVKSTGTLDLDTQRAIAEFERQRNLPITGRISEQLIRELSAVTGRTLE